MSVRISVNDTTGYNIGVYHIPNFVLLAATDTCYVLTLQEAQSIVNDLQTHIAQAKSG